MKKNAFVFVLILLLALMGCQSTDNKVNKDTLDEEPKEKPITDLVENTTSIVFGDDITIEGEGASIDSNGILISQGGTYILSGVWKDGMVKVDAKGERVELVLNGVSITNTDGPSIYYRKAKEAYLTIEGGTMNDLADGGDKNQDAVIFSKTDLTIRGFGDLRITGHNNEGIASEKSLFIEGGNLWITAPDDGLNASEENTSTITISGGYLFINAGGDGIDSNGSITIAGGTVISLGSINGKNGGLDADQDVEILGGTVIATGDRLKLPHPHRSQPYLYIHYDSVQKASELVSIIEAQDNASIEPGQLSNNSKGHPIVTFEPIQDFRVFLYSSPLLKSAASYEIYNGGTVSGESIDGVYPHRPDGAPLYMVTETAK